VSIPTTELLNGSNASPGENGAGVNAASMTASNGRYTSSNQGRLTD